MIVCQKKIDCPPKYNLRKRKIDFATEPPKKRVRQELIKNPVAKFISAKHNELKSGLTGLAKMKSYPKVAKILEVKKNNTVRVHFLGDYTTGTVKIADIGLIGENTALIQLNLSKKKNG